MNGQELLCYNKTFDMNCNYKHNHSSQALTLDLNVCNRNVMTNDILFQTLNNRRKKKLLHNNLTIALSNTIYNLAIQYFVIKQKYYFYYYIILKCYKHE